MKLTYLLQGTGFAKIGSLITAVYWDWRNSAHGNYYKHNCLATPTTQALRNSPQQQLFKTNPYLGIRFIVPFNHFFIYKSDNYVSTNHA